MQYGMFCMDRCEEPHVKRILTDDNNFEITVSSILMGFYSGQGVFTSCIPGVLRHLIWEAVLQTNSFLLEKKTITRNCTQYSLTWVFLPFVHIVF